MPIIDIQGPIYLYPTVKREAALLERLVFNEIPAGAVNGSNATFTSLNPFLIETLEVFVNGVKLTKLQDYNTSGNSTITLYASPGINETITINYVKL